MSIFVSDRPGKGRIMYEKGCLLIYGQSGVCRVMDVCSSPFDAADTRTFYVLKPEMPSDHSTIFVPVEVAESKIRDLMPKETALSILERIGEIPPVAVAVEKQRKDTYKQILQEASPEGYISIMKTVALRRMDAKRAKRQLAASDSELELRAKNLFTLELSFVLDIPLEEAAHLLSQKTEAAFPVFPVSF